MTTPPLHVLVIDDDADTRSNLSDILELDQYRVETAGTAAEALARTNWDQLAAIVLDRKLPDGTAEELLPRLRLLAPQAAVIIVTGYADVQGAVAAIRLGATDYILKPIDADELRARLGRIAERLRTEQELKRAQEQLLQSERLAAIGQMMTGLTHESGNALARSQSCLEMLTWEVEDRPAALDLIQRIQKAQDDLKQLYEEVRGYAAPLKLDRDVWDLSVVWRQAWENLALPRRGRDAALSFEGVSGGSPSGVPHGSPPEGAGGQNLRCAVDPFRLEQVFRNILENALAACADPVRVVIHCDEAEIDGQAAVRVSVRDNGPGLNPEQRQRIFDPFFTTKTKGTGLGMAIAKRIVEAHGGRIGVGGGVSGGGAEIRITLPREPLS